MRMGKPSLRFPLISGLPKLDFTKGLRAQASALSVQAFAATRRTRNKASGVRQQAYMSQFTYAEGLRFRIHPPASCPSTHGWLPNLQLNHVD